MKGYIYIMDKLDKKLDELVDSLTNAAHSAGRKGVAYTWQTEWRENTEAFSYYQEFWFDEIMRVRRRLPKGRSQQLAKKVL